MASVSGAVAVGMGQVWGPGGGCCLLESIPGRSGIHAGWGQMGRPRTRGMEGKGLLAPEGPGRVFQPELKMEKSSVRIRTLRKGKQEDAHR